VINVPETHYATLGDDFIAYQVFGDGDVDLLFVPASGDCIELRWDWAPYTRFLDWLGERARVISFDRRGTGASDPASGDVLPSWEQWADDARAVLDAVGSERAVLYGHADSGPTAILFAASHPSRTRGLILVNTSACYAAAPDYPVGMPEEALLVASQTVRDAWGTKPIGAWVGGGADFQQFFLKSQRMYMTPRAASRVFSFQMSLDVRNALALIRVPTLVLHCVEMRQPLSVGHGRYLAEHIEGADFAGLPGSDSMIFNQPATDALDHIEGYLLSLVATADSDRALAAILFTDIVGSTARASSLGDKEWRNLIETHDAVARTVVEQYKGRLVRTTGDGMLATFDGPGRAIRCAAALGEALRPLGLETRAGLHAGEIELMGNEIAGIGVHIAARVLEAARPGELLASPAIPMLVAGSGIEFEDRGEQELKGVPGTWRLYAVTA
jgi:class 3 adenylate cyclase/pimeloyl-ACP methyl ester carboxylesterase